MEGSGYTVYIRLDLNLKSILRGVEVNGVWDLNQNLSG